MMSYANKVKVLSGILVLLVAAWGLGELFAPERRLARSESSKLLAGKPGDVASFELSGSESLSFKKEGGVWFLLRGEEKLPAQGSRIESFIGAVAAIDRLGKVASAKEAWAGLGLDEAKRVTAKTVSGSILADFRAGDFGATASELYIRLEGSDGSYSIPSTFASYLSAPKSSWLDLRVLRGPAEAGDVQALNIRSTIALDTPVAAKGVSPASQAKPVMAPLIEWRITRSEKGWQSSAPVDPVQAESLLRSVLNLEASDVGPANAPFGEVSAKIEITFGNGAAKILEVGAEAGEGRRYLRASSESLVYEASLYSLKAILKPLSDLAPKN